MRERELKSTPNALSMNLQSQQHVRLGEGGRGRKKQTIKMKWMPIFEKLIYCLGVFLFLFFFFFAFYRIDIQWELQRSQAKRYVQKSSGNNMKWTRITWNMYGRRMQSIASWYPLIK